MKRQPFVRGATRVFATTTRSPPFHRDGRRGLLHLSSMVKYDSRSAKQRRAIMPTMAIVDLRQLTARQIEPLLQEEARFWRDELRWDYRNSIEVIRRFVDARSLAGAAVLENGEPA